jgi:hypothetical protein
MRWRRTLPCGLLLTLALHIAIIYALLKLDQPASRFSDSKDSRRILIRLIEPQSSPALTRDPGHEAIQQRVPRSRSIVPSAKFKPHSPRTQFAAPAAASKPKWTPAQKEFDGAEARYAPTPAPSLNLDQLLESTKRDIGKIDRELRKADPVGNKKSLGSSQSALEKGIAGAGAAVRPKWYEAAKIEGLPGGGDGTAKSGGPKRYKIITGSGLTYCVTDPGDGSPKQVGLCAEIRF